MTDWREQAKMRLMEGLLRLPENERVVFVFASDDANIGVQKFDDIEREEYSFSVYHDNRKKTLRVTSNMLLSQILHVQGSLLDRQASILRLGKGYDTKYIFEIAPEPEEEKPRRSKATKSEKHF